jgi:hypothetical protein
MLNRRDSNVEPRRTPDDTEKEEENFPKLRTKEDLFDK